MEVVWGRRLHEPWIGSQTPIVRETNPRQKRSAPMASFASARTSQAICVEIALLVLLSASAVFGNTITVVSTQDSGPGSLRDAIASAAPGDTIGFNVPLPATITVSTPLTFGPSVTISGPGSDSFAVHAGASVVVCPANPGAPVNISSLRLAHGSSLLGGGVFNAGTLTLTDVELSDNAEGTQLGGAIFNAGTLTLVRCALLDNSAEQGGGLYNDQGALTVDHSRFEFNVASGSVEGHGGGLQNFGGTVIVTDSIFLENISGVDGGGISNQGAMTVTRSSLSGNSAIEGGGISNAGTLTVTSSTIAGNTGGNVAGEGGSGGIVNDQVLTLTNSTIADNLSVTTGGTGGILNRGDMMLVSNSTISGNIGGGIANEFLLVEIKNSLVANNSS